MPLVFLTAFSCTYVFCTYNPDAYRRTVKALAERIRTVLVFRQAGVDLSEMTHWPEMQSVLLNDFFVD